MLTFFNMPIRLKCTECEKKHVLFIEETVLPLEKHLLFHTALMLEKKHIEIDAFMIEIGEILTNILKKMRNDDMIIFLETLSNDLYRMLEQIDFGDMYLICHFPLEI